MEKENKVIVKLNCFPARSLAARRVGVSRFFVSDRRSSVRSKIGRCRITTFRQNTDFNVGLTPDLHAKQRGFTLIELLVVVLIIGILAAVALPQYKFAVAKARLTQLVTAGQSIKQAEERYYLANNSYTDQWEDLDVSLEGTLNENGDTLTNLAGWSGELVNASNKSRVMLQDTRIAAFRLYIYFDHSQTLPNAKTCYAKTANSFANLLCRNITNRAEQNGVDGVWSMYSWN